MGQVRSSYYRLAQYFVKDDRKKSSRYILNCPESLICEALKKSSSTSHRFYGSTFFITTTLHNDHSEKNQQSLLVKNICPRNLVGQGLMKNEIWENCCFKAHLGISHYRCCFTTLTLHSFCFHKRWLNSNEMKLFMCFVTIGEERFHSIQLFHWFVGIRTELNMNQVCLHSSMIPTIIMLSENEMLLFHIR